VDEIELVNWDVFCRTRSELGAGFARILSYFREDGEKAVATIEAAMHRSDTAGLVLPAHTMKSEARQFGAEPLGQLAEEIEIDARRAVEMRTTPEQLVPQVARLGPLYRRTMAQLDAEANPLRRRQA
jgi:HPt (histidine-containing phosphotransfer) domain-containing protein